MFEFERECLLYHFTVSMFIISLSHLKSPRMSSVSLVSFVSLIHIIRESLEQQRSNTHLNSTKTPTPTLEHRYFSTTIDPQQDTRQPQQKCFSRSHREDRAQRDNVCFDVVSPVLCFDPCPVLNKQISFSLRRMVWST